MACRHPALIHSKATGFIERSSIISYAVRLYYRFSLNLRDVEELLAKLATLTLNKTVTPLNDNYELNLFARPTQIQAKALNLLGVKPERTQ